MDQIYFSIIIPSYNRLNELKRCLKSISEQTYKYFEVIVVDDFSKINLLSSINLSDYNFDISIIRNIKNSGAPRSRNIGIDNAKYEWIAFLDDDDKWLSNKLSVISTVIKENPKSDFIYHNAEIVMVNENLRYFTKQKLPDNYYQSMLIKNFVGGTPMVIIKRSLLLNHGKFDESLSSLQDYELWLRLAKYFNPVYLNKPLTVCYYTTKFRSISKSVENNLKSANYINAKYANDISQLNSNQLSVKKEWELSRTAYKYSLNYKRVNAFKCYLNAFMCRKNIKFIIASMLVIISPKLLFKTKKL